MRPLRVKSMLRVLKTGLRLSRAAACFVPVFTSAQWRAISRHLRLSPRELQIVRLIFDGKREAAITEELEISAHTVPSYVKRRYRQLEITGRSGLLIRVFAAHLAARDVYSGKSRCVVTRRPETQRGVVP